MILFHLGAGQNYHKMLRLLDEKHFNKFGQHLSPSDRKKHESQARVSFIACSCRTLLNIQNLAKLSDGQRVMYHDGTHGTLADGSKLIVYLTSDVKY